MVVASPSGRKSAIPLPTPSASTKRAYRRWAIALWVTFAVLVVGAIVFFYGLSLTNLPSLRELEDPKSELASEVYAADGSTLGRYYVENRVAVNYADLNPYLVDALLSTEDIRYYKHAGIDWWGLARAVGRFGKDGGASTITQQLAKQMFTGVASSSFVERVAQKTKEWIIATRLERNYTKEEILAMYLNKFEFNYNAYGIEAASEIYFSKPQSELSINESAMFIGMLKSPTYYNPYRNPENARRRREVVLKQMVRAGRLDAGLYDSLRQAPLEVKMQRQSHVDGLAPYFRMELRKEIRRILADPTRAKVDGEPYDVNRDGLRVFTTIDPRIQELAEEAAWEHMSQLQATYREQWADKDPWTYVEYEGEEQKTTEQELDYRKRRLVSFIRSTSRYESLRKRVMGPVLQQVGETFDGWDISDRDIDRVAAEEKGGKTIRALKRSNSIGETLEGRYRGLLGDAKLWTQVKNARLDMDRRLKAEFDEPVAMTVFGYNEAQQLDTVMSPLDSIKYHRSFLQIGSMAVDPTTGFVKSWIGGVNYRWFPFDHVQSRRQVGSTFKPFIYATAIAQQGISPCYRVADLPQTIRVGEGGFHLQKDWAPNNANGEFTGEYLTLMNALRKSKNTVSVYLMKQLGDTEPVRGLVNNMGIDSSARYSSGRLVVPQSPSIALGATDLSVEEMSGAYTTFANNGTYVKPIIVQRIEDKNGRTLYQAMPEERSALDAVSNYTMLRMLQYAAAGARGFQGVETAYGGKTGTTNDYVDGWFMGVTPNLVVGTWVGGDERYIRFTNLRYGQGGYMARPFFSTLLKKLEAKAEDVEFVKGAQFVAPAAAKGLDFSCEDSEGIYAGPSGIAPDSTEDNDAGFPVGGFGDQDAFGSGGLGDDSFGDEFSLPAGEDTAPVDTTEF